MKEEAWNLFLKTGNIETYLLLKQLESAQLEKQQDEQETQNQNMTFHTKI